MAEARYSRALAIVQQLPREGPVKPTTDDRLYFYKYFKQVSVGDVNTPRPGMFEFEAKAKWDAWNSVKGTPKEKCWECYANRLYEMLKKCTDTEFTKKYLDELDPPS